MTGIRVIWVMISVASLLTNLPAVEAHHSASDVVEALSERIEAGEQTASMYVRRGDEYRTIGQWELALADYRTAVDLDADFLPAAIGLARTLVRLDRREEARAIAEHGVEIAADVDQRGPFHALLARLSEEEGAWQQAVVSWRRALESSRPEVDWFLGDANALVRLDRQEEARRSLEAAMRRNSSVVLRRAWIESLIACGRHDQAAAHIEGGVARARWKSSWLLLRARNSLAQGEVDAAGSDARHALDEIKSRESPKVANPFLIADRKVAIEILAQSDAASN